MKSEYQYTDRFDDPSTTTAKFLKGTHDGKLGSRKRNLPESGLMSESEDAYKRAIEGGLPDKIKGDPLGCGCQEASLNAVGEVVDGMLEVDYTCDSDWHNFVVFQVRQQATGGTHGIKINKFGEFETSEGFEAGELGEM